MSGRGMVNHAGAVPVEGEGLFAAEARATRRLGAARSRRPRCRLGRMAEMFLRWEWREGGEAEGMMNQEAPSQWRVRVCQKPEALM